MDKNRGTECLNTRFLTFCRLLCAAAYSVKLIYDRYLESTVTQGYKRATINATSCGFDSHWGKLHLEYFHFIEGKNII